MQFVRSMADTASLAAANSGLKLESLPSLGLTHQAQQAQQQQLKDGCAAAAAAAAVEAEEDRKLLAKREAELDAEREAGLKLQR